MGLGGFAEEAVEDDYRAYIRSLFNKGSGGFRCLRLGHKESDNLKETVICVLGLAMVYPNFDYIALPNSVHNEFMTLLEETIDMDRIKQFAPRFQRLLFSKTI